jgi:hypothetical protein
MSRRFTKKRLLAAVSVVAALAIAATAFAFFRGHSNEATGSATVGTSTQWGISLGTATFSGTPALTAIYPGTGTEYFPFTVTNNGKGYQNLATITPSVNTNRTGSPDPAAVDYNPLYGDAQTAAGADIAYCLASWFTVVNEATPALPHDLAPGATHVGQVDLTMTNLDTTPQDACQGKAPGITITAAS